MAQQQWFSGFPEITQRVATFLPLLVGAAVLLLAGWLLGRVLAWLARRLVRALFTTLAKRPSLHGALESSGAATRVPKVIGAVVFWMIFVFFIAAAMETLGLPVATASLNRVAYYLPNLLAALLVVFAGLIAGKVIGSAVTRAASGTGMALASTIGGTVRGTVMLVAIVVAMEQVGIKADILIVIIAVIVGAALAGAGLAFGLGARTAVSNIIASHYVAQAYHVGQTVRVGNIEGKIIETTPTAVFIAGREGRVLIPAKQFGEEVSVLITQG